MFGSYAERVTFYNPIPVCGGRGGLAGHGLVVVERLQQVLEDRERAAQQRREPESEARAGLLNSVFNFQAKMRTNTEVCATNVFARG